MRLFGIIQDVTELRQNERALADSKARLRAVLDVAVTGIIVHDDKGRIQLFNPAAEQLFGYRAAEARGLTIDTLIPPMPCAALANLPHLGVARKSSHGPATDGLSRPIWRSATMSTTARACRSAC